MNDYSPELCMLACLVLRPAIWPKVLATGMTTSWFDDYEAARVFDSWSGLAKADAWSDAAAVAMAPKWIMQEIEACAKTIAHDNMARYYVGIMRDRWALRRLHMLATTTARDARRALGGMDQMASALIDEAVANLERVRRGEETCHEFTSRLPPGDIDAAFGARPRPAHYRRGRPPVPTWAG